MYVHVKIKCIKNDGVDLIKKNNLQKECIIYC